MVALSGGVDSSVVAALAFEALGNQAHAATFESPLTPPDEIEDARAVAQTIGIQHHIKTIDELKVANITKNPQDRCYHCKLYRFRQARVLAVKLGIDTVVDGTTKSDLGEYRPGLKALEELDITSPLLEVGITKEETRELAKQLKLPIADKPSNSCLATRIPYGEQLTNDRLGRVAVAEQEIKKLGLVRTIRVRDHGDLARIEVAPDEIPKLFQEEQTKLIVEKLTALGYRYVTIDLQGYRFGSFDEAE